MHLGFPGGSNSKETACNARNWSSILGLGRSPEERNGNPLLYSCLENPMKSASETTVVSLSLFFSSIIQFHCWSLTSPFMALLSPSCLTYELGTQISSVFTSLVSQLHTFLLPSCGTLLVVSHLIFPGDLTQASSIHFLEIKFCHKKLA